MDPTVAAAQASPTHSPALIPAGVMSGRSPEFIPKAVPTRHVVRQDAGMDTPGVDDEDDAG
jgi:hypothetical protein